MHLLSLSLSIYLTHVSCVLASANVAYSVAYTIGSLLSEVWDVSNDSLSSGDFSGMWRLTLLTSCMNPLGA